MPALSVAVAVFMLISKRCTATVCWQKSVQYAQRNTCLVGPVISTEAKRWQRAVKIFAGGEGRVQKAWTKFRGVACTFCFWAALNLQGHVVYLHGSPGKNTVPSVQYTVFSPHRACLCVVIVVLSRKNYFSVHNVYEGQQGNSTIFARPERLLCLPVVFRSKEPVSVFLLLMV